MKSRCGLSFKLRFHFNDFLCFPLEFFCCASYIFSRLFKLLSMLGEYFTSNTRDEGDVLKRGEVETDQLMLISTFVKQQQKVLRKHV